ncbi:TPA: tRNA 2-thiouridine(34) synthase MnmA [Candidatus Poribacteria bacterium]|nr:tRNA 2-thiouridine(34) synthase MnmA [Candidatus Poribacteria bacterium]HEX29068.1 tRNA 2-thiouridine(34) synthase MnmA [Candidatus Poribacteria bacterium]
MAKRVMVAMSGGVDSSVAAAVLKEQGYQVVGVTMRLGYHDSAEPSESTHPTCCSLDGVENARRVASQLGIPFYVLNFEEIFSREIIDYFCREYSRGRTPNPCIICNERLKFGRLLQIARGLGIDYVATGHYARVEFDRSSRRFILKRGIDPDKDQSYALFSLKQYQLKHIILPLGNMRKSEVRRIADRLGLKTASKPESQDLCFISDNDYARFLKERMPDEIKPGPIITADGRVVGRHPGIQFFTVGQRKGLGVSLGKPMYVVRIDPDRNALIIGTREELMVREFTVSGLNLISVDKIDQPMRVDIKVRYKDPGRPGLVEQIGEDRAKVIYDQPHGAVTPGQAAVFYDGDVLVGGGWID